MKNFPKLTLAIFVLFVFFSTNEIVYASGKARTVVKEALKPTTANAPGTGDKVYSPKGKEVGTVKPDGSIDKTKAKNK